MARRIVVLALTMVLAGCGGGDTDTTTTASVGVTSIPPISVTTVPVEATSTTTTLAPTLATPPVFDRWTTILVSLPIDDWDEPAATEQAFTLVDYESGLLLSDDYPSLNPGYWVVFSGDFLTQEEALAHCRSLLEQDVACYHRFLGEAPVVVAGRAEGTLVAWVDGDLAVVDAETGAVDRAVTDVYGGGGIFPGSLELGVDGTGVYFSVGFEDFWYSCDASAGRVDYVDLTSGDATEIATGFEPRISPDGSRLAYIASAHCIPDPDNENEVISFYDTVAVLDLVTGRTQTWGPSPGTAQSPASLVESLAWAADGSSIYVSMEEGSLRVVNTAVGAALDATPALGAGRSNGTLGGWVLEGVHSRSGNLIVVENDYGEDRSRIVEIDPVTGDVVDRRAWRSGLWTARLDGGRSALLFNSAGVVSGAPAGDLGPDPFFTGPDW